MTTLVYRIAFLKSDLTGFEDGKVPYFLISSERWLRKCASISFGAFLFGFFHAFLGNVGMLPVQIAIR
jgi:hypothetical protein